MVSRVAFFFFYKLLFQILETLRFSAVRSTADGTSN